MATESNVSLTRSIYSPFVFFTDTPGTLKISETIFIFLSALSLNLRLARCYLLSLPTLFSKTISGTLHRSQNSPSGNNKQLTLNFNQSEKQRQ